MTSHSTMMHDVGEHKFSIMPLYERSALKRQKKEDKLTRYSISGHSVGTLLLYPRKQNLIPKKRPEKHVSTLLCF